MAHSASLHTQPGSANSIADRLASDPVYLACLRAAQKNVLRRKQSRMVCPVSASIDIGWFPLATWSDYQIDSSRGGPWSAETVAHLCGLGWLGVHPDNPETARITKEGASVVRKARAAEKARTALPDTQPETPSQSPGDRT